MFSVLRVEILTGDLMPLRDLTCIVTKTRKQVSEEYENAWVGNIPRAIWWWACILCLNGNHAFNHMLNFVLFSPSRLTVYPKTSFFQYYIETNPRRWLRAIEGRQICLIRIQTFFDSCQSMILQHWLVWTKMKQGPLIPTKKICHHRDESCRSSGA